MWAPEPVWTRWRKIPSFPCRESNPGRPARTLVTIPTELPRFEASFYAEKINMVVVRNFKVSPCFPSQKQRIRNFLQVGGGTACAGQQTQVPQQDWTTDATHKLLRLQQLGPMATTLDTHLMDGRLMSRGTHTRAPSKLDAFHTVPLHLLFILSHFSFHGSNFYLSVAKRMKNVLSEGIMCTYRPTLTNCSLSQSAKFRRPSWVPSWLC
jgi:hypothetical protein